MICHKDKKRCYVHFGVSKKFDESGGQIREPLRCRYFDAFGNPGCFVRRVTSVLCKSETEHK
jgi:hypothetical protein